MVVERGQSAVNHRGRSGGDLQQAKLNAAEMSRLQNARGGLSPESSRPDQASGIACEVRKSRFTVNSQYSQLFGHLAAGRKLQTLASVAEVLRNDLPIAVLSRYRMHS